MAGAKLQFEIAANLEKAGFKDAAKHVKKIASETEGAGKASVKASKGTDLLKTAYTGLLGIGVIAFFKDAIDSAAKAEEITDQLARRVETAGVSWSENRRKIQAYTAALQEVTRFSQEEAEVALTHLIDQTNNVRESQELLTLAMDLSIAKNIDLAAASDLVGGVAQGVSGKLGQLAEMLGLDASEAKNAAEMMQLLEDRFDGVARAEENLISKQLKFKNASADFKKQVGEGFSPAMVIIMESLVKGGKLFGKFIDIWSAGWIAFGAAVTGNFDTARNALSNIRIELTNMKKIWEGKDIKTDLEANLVDPTVSAAKKMTQEMIAWKKKLADEVTAIDQNMIFSDEARILAAHDRRKEQLTAMKDFELLSEKDKLDLMKGLNERYQADVAALEQASMSRRVQVAAQFANVIGTGVGNMLAGQKDAWRDASKAIIDMIAQQTQAAVIANTIQGASKEFAEKGIYGFVTAAPIIAWGLAQVGAIAAAAAAAKGAIGSGSSGTPSTPSASAGPGVGLGGGGGGSIPASTPAAESSTRVVNVNIYGDQYGEQEFIERLGERLSSAVENADLRLVATQTSEEL